MQVYVFHVSHHYMGRVTGVVKFPTFNVSFLVSY